MVITLSHHSTFNAQSTKLILKKLIGGTTEIQFPLKMNMNFMEAQDNLFIMAEELKVMNKKAIDLKDMLLRRTEDLKTFLTIMDEEKKDVEALKKTTLSGIMAKIAGNYDKLRDREYQEYLDAKTKYNLHYHVVNKLKSEVERAGSEIARLTQEYINQKDRLFIAYPEGMDMAEKYKVEKTASYTLRKELLEAKRAVEDVLTLSRNARVCFEDTQEWSLYDTFFKGVMLKDSAKYLRIDQANEAISLIHSFSLIMNKELKDVDMAFNESINIISADEKFFDMEFDNIFGDWNVTSKIKNNLSSLNT